LSRPDGGFAAFHMLHHGDRPLLLPNACDYASAAAFAAQGFAAVATTSLGVAAAAAKRDDAAVGLDERVALARVISRLPCWSASMRRGASATGPTTSPTSPRCWPEWASRA
jgi:2-methylisocitrate lyase-like PEP mutase family enzyme